MPPADLLPLPTDPLPDPTHPLAMRLCPACGLAQLSGDASALSEPRAVEPDALRRQAADAVEDLSGWWGDGERRTVAEFGSPHGGSWLPLLGERGWRVACAGERADLVVDSFGLMHDPDQREAMELRAARLRPGGLLLLVFPGLETMLRERQWSALRHGHYAYWSLTALHSLLDRNDLEPIRVREHTLYGGTLVVAVRSRAAGAPVDPGVSEHLAREARVGVSDAARLRGLQTAADEETAALSRALESGASDGGWWAYGAASRSVALLARARATPATVRAVADASAAKQGRALPSTRIPIVSPDALVAAAPPRIWLLLPDLLPEVERALPALTGRFVTRL